ncbi:MAG: N-acetylmuramoyl-L-alanine amidase [Tissierellia bacterium]|nr:N-acetylmuramoyl-L-alanine amidase [Tissierellia bacterium]
MKKTFLMIVLIGTMIFGTVYADSNFKVKINKKNYNVHEAKVTVNGNPLDSEFTPYVKEDRTFVPLREISESLGAKVIWNDKNKTVEVQLNEEKVKLQIGTSVVYVNGQKKTIDKGSIPQLSTYQKPRQETKTMVPLRFLTEAFGYHVNWDQKEQLATVSTTSSLLVASNQKEMKNQGEKSKSLSPSKGEGKTKNQGNSNYYQSDIEAKETHNINKKMDKDKAEEVYESVGLDLGNIKSEEKREITKTIKKEGSLNIVIDAGHGGRDSGAVGIDGKTLEKDLTLEVALKVYDKLVANGYQVDMTRTQDEYVKLLDRASLANENDAEIFVSIHFNAADSAKAKGIEVLYASEKNIKIKNVEQKHLANELLKSLIDATDAENRGIKNRPAILVLNKTKNVSALVELGFISNEEELKIIKSDGYIDKLAEGLYNGIVNYVNKYVEE